MGIISRNGHSRQRMRADDWSDEGNLALEDRDTGLGRCEAQAFAAPERAVDPYAAWLERREDERERERSPIRWIYRHEAAAAATAREDSDLVGTA